MKPFRAVQINRSTGQGVPLLNNLEMKKRTQQLQRDKKRNGLQAIPDMVQEKILGEKGENIGR